MEVEKTAFSPRKMLADLQAPLMQQASEKRIALRISIGESLPEFLEGDAGRLRQVLLNLAGNALKFTSHGSVEIGFRARQGEPMPGEFPVFEFSVRDTGPGIASGQLEKIFQPFTQADSSI